MSNLFCCGRNFANKFTLRRHIKATHSQGSPVFKCFLEGCFRRFKSINSLREHQQSHIYNSEIFYVKTQAFNNTTLVLRNDLTEQGLENFDFLISDETIEEVRKILCSEVVKKQVLTFSIALTIEFVKFGTDGEIMAKVSPCFISSLNYLNNVSNFNVSEIIHSSVIQIQKRYDDFVGKGSGWTLQGLKFYDLHITQTYDLRGGCDKLLIGKIHFCSEELYFFRLFLYTFGLKFLLST